jgi:hypothetical protein
MRKVRFLNKLRLTVDMMKKVKAHYKNYPDMPEDFEPWRKQTLRLFETARGRLEN